MSLQSLLVSIGLSLLLVASPSALAIHAYRSSVCENADIHLEYTGNYPLGGSYSLRRQGQNVDITIWEDGEFPEGSDNSFKTVRYEVASQATVPAACDSGDEFDFDETHSEILKALRITALSPDAQTVLQIAVGEEIVLNCTEVLYMPKACGSN